MSNNYGGAIRHQNVRPLVTEVPIDPENCPFAFEHTLEGGAFVFLCRIDKNKPCMICSMGKDCDKVIPIICKTTKSRNTNLYEYEIGL